MLSGNDWTTETLISQITKGNIQLNPNFQRRDAWDKSRKSKFIESLILGLPVPQVVLAESKEQRGSYIVLDGKQRLLSIRQFAADENDGVYEQLKLSGLEIRRDLIGLNLDSLRKSTIYFDELSSFENQPIRTVVIKNWPNERFLYHVFLRLNTGSVSLSPQELRQALHPGLFVTFLDLESSKSSSLREILKNTKADFRMRDAELLLRFIAYKNFLNAYSGSLKDFLDATCKRLNDEWHERELSIKSDVKALESAHQKTKEIFGKNSYRKWTGAGYENRFNRAIYDVMMLSFSDPSVRMVARGKAVEIEEAFKNLCTTDIDFKTSIETTTKSISATCARISIWNKTLNDVINTNLHVPVIVGNKII